jgi:hypothetical protein
MEIEVTSFVLGAAAGAILMAALAYPRVGRIMARSFAVLASGAGAGLLVWAIYAAARGEPLQAIRWGMIVVSEASEAIGWSAGLLLSGITSLVLSFLGRST